MVELKIGNRTYSLSQVDDQTFDAFLAKFEEDDQSIKSLIDYDDQIILVRKRLRNDHKVELFLHEILHALIEDAGYSRSERSDEEFISILSPRLVSILPVLYLKLEKIFE